MPATTPPLPPPQLDETCDRIVAALTRRLARAAEHALPSAPPPTGHDFLMPAPCPELSEEKVPETIACLGR